jgi:polycomb protein EED
MLPDNLKDNLGSDNPIILRYPHFSSTEVHANYVDCVRFYNDLIFSRAAEEDKILLWKIENFNSDAPPPTSLPMPPSQAVQSDKTVSVPASSLSGTRSAWGGRFQRLLQFAEPNSELFYIRFGLFYEAGKHPILAAGNQKSRIFQWDLQRLEDAGLEDEKAMVKKRTKKDASVLSQLKSTRADRIREGSVVSNASSAALSNSSAPSTSTGIASASTTAKKGRPVKEKEKRTTGIGDPFMSISPHDNIMVPKVEFTVRQVTFSRGGEWCVACGEHGMIAVLSRWEEGFPDPET